MRNSQGSVSHLSGFFTKDCTEQSFLSAEVVLALRCNLTYQNVCGFNLCTNSDNTFFVQILQRIVTHVRDVSGDFFWSQLGISRFCFIFYDVKRSQNVVHQKFLVEDDRVLVVVTFPSHESNQKVLSEGDFTQFCRRSVSDDFSFFYVLAVTNNWSLVDTGTLVGSLELEQFIFV